MGRYWSTRKVGQDEGQLRVNSGALFPVATVELPGKLVLVKTAKGAGAHTALSAAPNMPALLQAMQYRDAREVRLSFCT